MLTPASPEDSELFFALIGPAGCDLDSVVEGLRTELCSVDFSLLEPIKLAAMFHTLKPHEHLSNAGTEDERIRKHMDAGDEVREKVGDAGAVAALAVAEICAQRDRGDLPRRRAFVFRSLKHPQEVRLLREVYGTNLIVLSVYEPKWRRIDRLAQRIERSRGKKEDTRSIAERLVERDQRGDEEGGGYGQNVREAFPLADFFIKAGPEVQQQLSRLIKLLFGHPFITPTRDEHSMFIARACALRSGDMSRQVGAVIANSDAEVLATGCNEVPKFGGGTYWAGDEPDGRDFPLGHDPNAIMRREILLEVMGELKQKGLLKPELGGMDVEKIVAQVNDDDVFEGARISNLIEFGRVVHAEMNALSDAAKRGVATQGAILYCTTFPCHGCARHLLSAGITEVVYIEPYPKSLAEELYAESIQVGSDPLPAKLLFRPFLGVAPRAHLRLFEFGRRKDSEGYAATWIPASARPKAAGGVPDYLLIERDLCGNLESALVDKELIDDPADPATETAGDTAEERRSPQGGAGVD